MLATPTPTLKKAYTPLLSLKALKGKRKGKRKETTSNSTNKDIVNTLEK